MHRVTKSLSQVLFVTGFILLLAAGSLGYWIAGVVAVTLSLSGFSAVRMVVRHFFETVAGWILIAGYMVFTHWWWNRDFTGGFYGHLACYLGTLVIVAGIFYGGSVLPDRVRKEKQ